jgi:hypothetical protein
MENSHGEQSPVPLPSATIKRPRHVMRGTRFRKHLKREAKDEYGEEWDYHGL